MTSTGIEGPGVTGGGGGGGTPGAPTTSVQFNDGGVFGGSSGFTFDKGNITVRVTTGPVVTALVPNYVAQGDPAGLPIYELSDQASAVDNRRWWLLASGALQIAAVSDAGVSGGFGLQLTRSGTAITQAILSAGARTLGINTDGSFLLNGSVGVAGQVPISVGAGAAAWGNVPAYLGERLAYASPTGGAVAANPAITPTTGRLIVTLPGGDATWVSLTAGTDGQLMPVVNADAVNTLTLPATVFGGVADLVLPPKARTFLYYDATDALWERTA